MTMASSRTSKKRFSLGDAVLMHDGSIGIVLSQEGDWVRVATIGPEGHLIQADFRADYLRRAAVKECREQ